MNVETFQSLLLHTNCDPQKNQSHKNRKYYNENKTFSVVAITLDFFVVRLISFTCCEILIENNIHRKIATANKVNPIILKTFEVTSTLSAAISKNKTPNKNVDSTAINIHTL